MWDAAGGFCFQWITQSALKSLHRSFDSVAVGTRRGRCYSLPRKVSHLLFVFCSTKTTAQHTRGDVMSHNQIGVNSPILTSKAHLALCLCLQERPSLYASQTVRSTMKLFLERITGCLNLSGNSYD